MNRTAWLCTVAGLCACLSLAPPRPASADDLNPKAYPADARKLLEEVVQAYKHLDSYSDQGSIIINVTFAGGDAEGEAAKQNQIQRRTLVFSRPDKLAIITNSDLFVVDGKNATYALMRQGRYSVTPAPKTLQPKDVAALPGPGVPVARVFAGEAGLPTAILLDLLSSPDAGKSILEGTDGLKLEGEKERHGEKRLALLVDQSKGPDLRLLLDPKTKLIQAIEMVYNLNEVNANLPQGKKFKDVSIVWDAGTLNKGAVTGDFAIKLPDQFQRVAPGTGVPIEQPEKKGRETAKAKGEGDDQPEKNPADELIDKPAPDFSLTVLAPGGKTRKLTKAELAGKVVVIDFWATWCAPCLKELPEIQRLVQSLAEAKKDVVVVALSEDSEPDQLDDRRKLIENTLNEKRLKLAEGPVSLVALDPDGAIGTTYKVDSLPTVFIIDQKGTVRAVHVGYDDNVYQVLSAEINALLDGKPIPRPAAAEAESKKGQP